MSERYGEEHVRVGGGGGGDSKINKPKGHPIKRCRPFVSSANPENQSLKIRVIPRMSPASTARSTLPARVYSPLFVFCTLSPHSATTLIHTTLRQQCYDTTARLTLGPLSVLCSPLLVSEQFPTHVYIYILDRRYHRCVLTDSPFSATAFTPFPPTRHGGLYDCMYIYINPSTQQRRRRFRIWRRLINAVNSLGRV